MWKYQKGAAGGRVLGLVEVPAGDEELIGRTLGLTKPQVSWRVCRSELADLIIVDVDRPRGRSRWWALRRDTRHRAVIPLTARRELRHLQPLLLRPVCGHTLVDMLDHYREIRAGTYAPAMPAKAEPLLIEAIVNCAWSGFTVKLDSGEEYLFDVRRDLLLSESGLEPLHKRLFRPVDSASIQPAAAFARVIDSRDAVTRRPMSNTLMAVALAAGRADQLRIFRGNPAMAIEPGFDIEAVAGNPALYPIVCILAVHGPMELLELVLSSGRDYAQVCAVLAALWACGKLRLGKPAVPRSARAVEPSAVPFRAGPRRVC